MVFLLILSLSLLIEFKLIRTVSKTKSELAQKMLITLFRLSLRGHLDFKEVYMIERRSTRRRHLYDYFNVIDKKSHSLFGKLTNITPTGLNIETLHQVEPRQEYELEIVLPEHMKNPNISCSAISIWSSPSYKTGFLLSRITAEDESRIRTLF